MKFEQIAEHTCKITKDDYLITLYGPATQENCDFIADNRKFDETFTMGFFFNYGKPDMDGALMDLTPKELYELGRKMIQMSGMDYN